MPEGSQGFIEGQAQLGFVSASAGLTFIFAPWGACDNPAPGTLNAWIADPTSFQTVTMTQTYYPSYVGRYPARAMVLAGETAVFPAPEAAALIAAGAAVAA